MSRSVLSPRAQRDVEAIWTYTVTTWGGQQAEVYILQLKSAVALIAANPLLGRACDNIRRGYFKYPSGSHVLFYRVGGDTIDIVRILHERMDFKRHL